MTRIIPYSEQELRPIGELPSFFGGPPTPIKNTPVSPRENWQAMYYDRTPYWLSSGFDASMIYMAPPYGMTLGRGGVESGTVDSFGIEWIYIESAGGSIVKPGAPLLANANEWYDKIKIPNIDTWDWASAAESTPIDLAKPLTVMLVNGFWFERLISFMDFAEAAVALIDDDQKKAVHDLFAAMTDLGCKVIDKYCEYFPSIDIINIHDDWGSQQNCFFSEEVARELFLPYMKELTAHIHSKGRIASLHSCGHVEDRIALFVEAGWDEWLPQPMNDTHKLYDEWGDKIVLGVYPDPIPMDAPEDLVRQKAREFVDRFANKGKPCEIAGFELPPAFVDEAYIHSRKRYASLL